MISIAPPKAPGAVKRQEDAPLAPTRLPPPAPAGRALRALFFAYFWPSLPLAVCLLGGSALLVAIVKFQALVNPPRSRDLPVSLLLVDWIRVVVMIGCPVAGLVLGVFQSRGDADEKRWALMIHRPAGSPLLFLGRFLAGMALYGIAAGVPLAILWMWAFFQRGVPYHWSFMLPGIADALSGVVYYFAGVVIVLRAARMYASRLVPLSGAVGFSALTFAVPHFSHAVGVIALFLLVFGVAAHGAHARNGYRLGGSLPGRLATGVVFFSSFAFPAFITCIWLQSEAQPRFYQAQSELLHRRSLEPGWRGALLNGPANTVTYALLPDGGIARATRTPVHKSDELHEYTGTDVVTYVRLGPPEVPVTPSAEEMQALQNKTAYINEIQSPPNFRFLGTNERELRAGIPSRSDLLRPDMATAASPASAPDMARGEKWYYLQPVGILQGFDARTGELIGSIGKNGFRPGRAGVDGFGMWVGNDGNYVPESFYTSDGLYSVHLLQRTTRKNWEFPPSAGIVATATMSGGPETFALSNDTLFVYRPGKLARQLPLTHPLNENGLRIVHVESAHRWVLFYASRSEFRKPYYFAYYDENWSPVTEVQISEPRKSNWNAPPAPAWLVPQMNAAIRTFGTQLGAADALCCLPIISIFRSLQDMRPEQLTGGNLVDPVQTYDVAGVNSAYWSTAALVLVAAMLAMAFLTHSYRARLKWLWVLGAALLGPVLLLVLLCTHTRPVPLQCPACGRRNAGADARCRRCGTSFDNPRQNGTEIFAQAGGAA